MGKSPGGSQISFGAGFARVGRVLGACVVAVLLMVGRAEAFTAPPLHGPPILSLQELVNEANRIRPVRVNFYRQSPHYRYDVYFAEVRDCALDSIDVVGFLPRSGVCQLYIHAAGKIARKPAPVVVHEVLNVVKYADLSSPFKFKSDAVLKDIRPDRRAVTLDDVKNAVARWFPGRKRELRSQGLNVVDSRSNYSVNSCRLDPSLRSGVCYVRVAYVTCSELAIGIVVPIGSMPTVVKHLLGDHGDQGCSGTRYLYQLNEYAVVNRAENGALRVTPSFASVKHLSSY